jgi:eukaryotic-like serine/threonine-protein kinase
MIPPDLPDLIGGKYRPLGVIGVGAMGIVYSVEHTLTGEQLAVKVMTSHHGASRETIERFKREARASSKIKSEHVVRVIDADVAPELDRAPYLVMDLLEGTDLEKAAGDQPVAAIYVLEWMRQISRALDKAHRLGITHRDLKPENLFLTYREDGTPLIKILDFGIAKLTAESTGTTQSGQILGTPLYMSPEQARGDPAQIGPLADLYALGLIAFKLLNGAPYWKATSVAGIIGQVLYEPMTPPSASGCSLGPEFDQWFLRACNRDPAQRFRSASEQVETLAKALGFPADTRPEVLQSNPGASGDALHHLPQKSHPDMSSGSGKFEVATIAQSGGTLVSSSSETPDLRVATTPPRRRRKVVYAVMTAAALLSVLFVVFHQRETPAPGHDLVKPAAALGELAGTPPAPALVVAPAPLPPPEAPTADSAAAARASASPRPAPAIPATPVNVGKRKDLPKPPARPAPVPAPAHADKPVANDPLGDQK